MAFYCQKPGLVVLPGDSNAWVAHAGHAHLNPELAAAAPRNRDNSINARLIALLRMCSRLGLHFRSGAYQDGALPTFGRGNQRTTVDHIIASAPARKAPMSLVPCYTPYGDPQHPGCTASTPTIAQSSCTAQGAHRRRWHAEANRCGGMLAARRNFFLLLSVCLGLTVGGCLFW